MLALPAYQTRRRAAGPLTVGAPAGRSVATDETRALTEDRAAAHAGNGPGRPPCPICRIDHTQLQGRYGILFRPKIHGQSGSYGKISLINSSPAFNSGDQVFRPARAGGGKRPEGKYPGTACRAGIWRVWRLRTRQGMAARSCKHQ